MEKYIYLHAHVISLVPAQKDSEHQQMAGLTKRKRSQILNGERRNKNLLTSNKK
jgi:hypothetical protein